MVQARKFGGWLQQVVALIVVMQVRKCRSKEAFAEALWTDPEWCSVNLGIFICLECSGVHKSFGRNISHVKSVRLANWNESQTAVSFLIFPVGGTDYILRLSE